MKLSSKDGVYQTKAGNTDSAGTMETESVALANRLRPVLLHINRRLRQELHSLGIGASQVSILAAIRDQPGIGVADLAAKERISSPSICVHVDRLHAAGLVEKDRSPDDKRRRGLRLTSEGVRLLRTVRSRRNAWLASRIEALSGQQRRQLDEAVAALNALVNL